MPRLPLPSGAAVVLSLLSFAPLSVASQDLLEAPDASLSGPFETSTGVYRLPAEIYPDVRPDVITELWAKTHFPTNAPGDLPVLFFLHGNHSTCGTGSNPRIDNNCRYTNEGVCPDGYRVVPNHEGYDYLAEPLASWGYVVVSINANRGINCANGISGDSGLNKVRGRLILKHLELVSQWNEGLVDLPLAFDSRLLGRLDYRQLGLLGHSRGGEGARAAYAFYGEQDSPWVEKILQPVTFQAIFEIGAVDGQTDQVFDATSTTWNQVLPMCDGDVSNLEGVKPLDRMMKDLDEARPRGKSSYTVWGANHNFFNTEWQTSDSSGCLDHSLLPAEQNGSAAQRLVGRSAAMAMFRGAVGQDADRDFLRNFNPAYRLPSNVVATTRVDRGYVDSPRALIEVPVEDFSGPAGQTRWGFTIDTQGVSYSHATVPNHDESLRAARVSWMEADENRWLQINVSDASDGRDISGLKTLEFRVSRQTTQLDFLSQTDFTVSLVDGNGVQSVGLPLSDYAHLTGPVGGMTFFSNLRHPILQTVRIPLDDFAGADLSQVQAFRFTFDRPNPGQGSDDGGSIHLAEVRLSRVADERLEAFAALGQPPMGVGALDTLRPVASTDATIVSVERVTNSFAQLAGEAVEVTVASAAPFPVTDALPKLRVGPTVSELSRYSPDTRSVTFVFSGDAVLSGDTSELSMGGWLWDLGPFPLEWLD